MKKLKLPYELKSVDQEKLRSQHRNNQEPCNDHASHLASDVSKSLGEPPRSGLGPQSVQDSSKLHSPSALGDQSVQPGQQLPPPVSQPQVQPSDVAETHQTPPSYPKRRPVDKKISPEATGFRNRSWVYLRRLGLICLVLLAIDHAYIFAFGSPQKLPEHYKGLFQLVVHGPHSRCIDPIKCDGPKSVSWTAWMYK